MIQSLDNLHARNSDVTSQMMAMLQWKDFWEKEISSWKVAFQRDFARLKNEFGAQEGILNSRWLAILLENKQHLINLLQEDFSPQQLRQVAQLIADQSTLMIEANKSHGEVIVREDFSETLRDFVTRLSQMEAFVSSMRNFSALEQICMQHAEKFNEMSDRIKEL